MYRTREGRERRLTLTIGRHGAPWTPDSARGEAKRLLGEVVKGGDPAADKREALDAMTVAELCAHYVSDAEAGHLLTRRGQAKKASTLEIDNGRTEPHIKLFRQFLEQPLRAPQVLRRRVARQQLLDHLIPNRLRHVPPPEVAEEMRRE